jgi:hypothetical protein
VKDHFIRLWRSIVDRAGPSPAQAESRSEAYARFIGRPVLDPDGTRIGHVLHSKPDRLGGAWLDIEADWGALDWLTGMGSARNPHFTCHSDDVDEEGDRLRLKRAILAHRSD